jgi:CYTH domain-containing protein
MEWEKEISAQDFKDLLQVCHGSVIEKTRYIIPAGQAAVSESHSTHGKDRFFEVDVFHGDNEGLVMAEIELGNEEENFPRPSWLGEEVTGDKRYYNSYLTIRPYKTW